MIITIHKSEKVEMENMHIRCLRLQILMSTYLIWILCEPSKITLAECGSQNVFSTKKIMIIGHYYTAHTIKVWRIALHSQSRTDESESEGRRRMSVNPIVVGKFSHTLNETTHIIITHNDNIIKRNNLRKSERAHRLIGRFATFPPDRCERLDPRSF